MTYYIFQLLRIHNYDICIYIYIYIYLYIIHICIYIYYIYIYIYIYIPKCTASTLSSESINVCVRTQRVYWRVWTMNNIKSFCSTFRNSNYVCTNRCDQRMTVLTNSFGHGCEIGAFPLWFYSTEVLPRYLIPWHHFADSRKILHKKRQSCGYKIFANTAFFTVLVLGFRRGNCAIMGVIKTALRSC